MDDSATNRRLHPGRGSNDHETSQRSVQYQGPDDGDDDAASLIESLVSAHSASKQDMASHVSEERDNLGIAETEMEEAQRRSTCSSNPSVRHSSSSRSQSHHSRSHESGSSGKGGSDAGGASSSQRIQGKGTTVRGASEHVQLPQNPSSKGGHGSGLELGSAHGFLSGQGSGSDSLNACGDSPQTSTMIELRAQHDKTLLKNAEDLIAEKEHAKDKARTEARYEVQIESLQQRLDDALKTIAAMRSDHGENFDWLEAQLGQERSKVSLLMAEGGNNEMMEAIKADRANSLTKRQTAIAEANSIAVERDVLASSILSQMQTHKDQVDTLKIELEEARSLTGTSSKDTKSGDGKPSCTGYAAASAKVDAMSELRIEMLGLRQRKGTEIHDLQNLLETASAKLAQSGLVGVSSSPYSGLGVGIGGATSVVAPKKRPKNNNLPALAAIEEDDNQDVDESLSGSIIVSSSEGKDGVAELSDFDDNEMGCKEEQSGPSSSTESRRSARSMNSLQGEIENMLVGTSAAGLVDDIIQRFHDEINEGKAKLYMDKVSHAGRLAKDESTILRLRNTISAMNAAKEENDQQWRAAFIEKAEEMASESAELRHWKQLFDLVQDSNTNKATLLEDMRYQLGDAQGKEDRLHAALEEKRMAERRIEDFKMRVANMERDMESATSSTRSDSCGHATSSIDTRETDDLLRRLATLTQERNVLLNQLEGNEVMWRSKLDDMGMQHEAALLESRRQHEVEIRALKDENAVLRKQLTLAGNRQNLQPSPTSQTGLAGTSVADSHSTFDIGRTIPNSSSAPAQISAKAPWLQRMMAWLDALNCPTRNLREHVLRTSGSSAQHAQGVSWKILTHAPGVVALRCSVNDIVIQEASGKALQIFGPEAYNGENFLNLVGDKQKAFLLRRAICIQQDLAENATASEPAGFTLGNIGTVQFKDRHDKILRSAVTVVRLPPEPVLGKDACFVIIIDLESDKDDQRASHRRLVAPASDDGVDHNRSSGCSDISSVRPNDSASNVGM